jgi:hypothetical protein
MKIKLSSMLSCTAVLAFATVTALGTAYEAGSTTQPAHCVARIDASARPGTMYFPGRTRPLCAYPAYARYAGTGNLEDGANFTCMAPSDSAPARAASPVRGIFNWIHSTGDAERGFTFYRDVFGIELARSPFAGGASAGAPPEPIRPAAQAGYDPLVWDLTNTHGSRFRTVFMRAPNTPFGLELSEFFDIARGDRVANPWDPGASALIFSVRDLGRRRRQTEGPRRACRDARWCRSHNAEQPRGARPRSRRLPD